MTIVGGVLAAAGVLVAASGILGVLGRLPRNRWAGVRTSATLRSDRAFEAGNRVAGPAVVAGGIAGVAGGLLAMAVPDGAAVSCVLLGPSRCSPWLLSGAFRGTVPPAAPGVD